MNIILPINKPISKTPNQMIELVRQKFPHFANEKIGFAGRLDPMARGVLLLMVGDANFEREKYLNLDKTYQFTAILGLETDSYDLLGLLTSKNYSPPPVNYLELVDQFITENIGKKTQPYPPFSTKPVQGKQLFKWAREGKLEEIEIPTKEIEIYSFKKLNESAISLKNLEQTINDRIPKIEGHFRQEEILKTWNTFLLKDSLIYSQKEFPLLMERIRVRGKNNPLKNRETITLTTITFEVSCSSGTYVRSLVHNLGKKLGCNAVTEDIYRTKVGPYPIEKAVTI